MTDYFALRNSWQKCTCMQVIKNINWFSTNQSSLPGEYFFRPMFIKMIKYTIVGKEFHKNLNFFKNNNTVIDGLL